MTDPLATTVGATKGKRMALSRIETQMVLDHRARVAKDVLRNEGLDTAIAITHEWIDSLIDGQYLSPEDVTRLLEALVGAKREV